VRALVHYPHADAPATAGRQRLLGVLNQVEQGLQQVHGVALDDLRLRREIEVYGEIGPRNRVLPHADGPRRDLPQIHLIERLGLRPRQGHHAGHRASRPCRLLADARQYFLHRLGQVRAVLEEFHGPADDLESVVDLMSRAGHQPRNRRETIERHVVLGRGGHQGHRLNLGRERSISFLCRRTAPAQHISMCRAFRVQPSEVTCGQ